MLERLFSEPLRTIPGNEAHPVPPVVEAKVDPGGKFGFVEFRGSAVHSSSSTSTASRREG